jgi:hypothetical protein
MRCVRCALLGAALLCSAIVSFTASAGGWAVVTLDAMPTMVAGQETTIGFTLRQHGNTLLAGIEPSEIIFRNRETGERRTFPAPDAGPQGHYAAKVALPRAGTWEWTINAFGEHPMPPLTVTNTTLALAYSSASPIARPIAYPAVAVLAVIAVCGLVLGFRWRRAPAGNPLVGRREPQLVV